MKHYFAYLSGILLSIFMTACATSAPVPAVDARPAWIENPGNGVSASAGMNVRGRVAQEELAISRARVEFAKRFGVSIGSDQSTSTNVTNGHTVTVSNTQTNEETQQTNVKAMVKAKWRDEDADVLWVWLVPSN